MNTAGDPRGAVGPMTNNTPNPAAEAAQLRSQYEGQLRLNGTLVNELHDLKLDLQERDRQLADIYRRLEDQGAMDKAHIELLELWAERLSMLEDVTVAILNDHEEERSAFIRKAQPLKLQSTRNLRTALALADRIAARPPEPQVPASERWSNPQ